MVCKHCSRGVTNVGSDGKVYKSYVHTAGGYGGLHRCDPDDTGKPYGLEAEPKI